MIYLDASVALAELLTEDRRPPDRLWSERLVSSLLLKYEITIRLNERRLPDDYAVVAAQMLEKLEMIDLSPAALQRALRPFPAPVRTLDGLHLATAAFLKSTEPGLVMATYDKRMLTCALELGINAYPL